MVGVANQIGKPACLLYIVDQFAIGKHRIAILMGTRPEAIKLAPVIAALEGAADFEPIVINTGQHRELIDQVVSLFGIRVDRDLAVMQPNQSLASLTARLLTA